VELPAGRKSFPTAGYIMPRGRSETGRYDFEDSPEILAAKGGNQREIFFDLL
jgi:hypothetical protein